MLPLFKVDGLMESWVFRMATLLKTNLVNVNVVITDWMSLARQHYPLAVLSTRTVGKDIAHLLQKLQVRLFYFCRETSAFLIIEYVLFKKVHFQTKYFS